MEALQKMSDPVLTDCPVCQQAALRKQLTAAAFQLKGTGWYATDFRNSGKPAAEKSDASGAESGKSASSTTDSVAAKDSTAAGGAPGQV